MDLTYNSFILLSAVGFVAGIINTLAGGGSNLTIPALMVLGLPTDAANASNRIAVLLQGIVGVAGFDKHKTLDRPAIIPILIPTVSGGFLGGLGAALLPNLYLKPVLLLTILIMSIVILVMPGIMAPPSGTPTISPKEDRRAWWGLFTAGIYGGFVQAGVGFILLAALAGNLRYDLVRANALKMACSLAFTLVSLLVFIAFGQVRWLPGLVVAIGAMAGTHLAVKWAVRARPETLKWLLFIMTLIAVASGFYL